MIPGIWVSQVSIGARNHAYAGCCAYCLSKTALLMPYHLLCAERYYDADLAVGRLHPGAVDSSMQSLIRIYSEAVFPAVGRLQAIEHYGAMIFGETDLFVGGNATQGEETISVCQHRNGIFVTMPTNYINEVVMTHWASITRRRSQPCRARRSTNSLAICSQSDNINPSLA